MPRTRTLFLLAALLTAAGLLAGCSDEAADPLGGTTASDDFSQMDFSQAYGGLTATDEDVAFGDDSLQMELLEEEESEVEDPWAADAAVQQLLEDGNHPYDPLRNDRPRFTFVKLRWGMLRDAEDTLAIEPPCPGTDWSGTIRTDRGYVVVKRLIRFERPADTIVWPRLDAQTVALVSRTYCHLDGVVLQIVERPVDETAPDYEPNRLHIDLGPYQGEFAVSDLAGLDEVAEIDDMGNRMQITGFQVSDIEVCPKGFLSGRYRHVEDDAEDVDPGVEDEETGTHLGNFVGKWTNLEGRIRGFLRGGYGLDADGNRVFHGKFIDRKGHFHGLLSGTWTPGGTDDDLATFLGGWINAAGTREGELGGNAYPVEEYPGGFFAGRWAELCDDEALDEIK